MKNQNNTTIVVLLSLIAGLIVGYLLGVNRMPHQGFFLNDSMYEEMEEHMYGDEFISRDGAMMHAMDEMMLGFRGKSGQEYEEIFLRSMIVHHLGAVRMSENLLEETSRPELREFAQDIITNQTQEIEKMKGWINTWFANEN